ncbi:uncharacterized protein HaLaN_04836, partial [Haematococcus lacustris]
MVRGWFTRLRGLLDGQEVFEEIPAEDAFIPNLADRNMFLQLIRGLPPPGRRSSQPSAAVEDVLALYLGLHARLNAVPRYEHDSNTVDDVGTKLETNFAKSLTELCSCKAHHIKLDTRALYGLMRTAGMLQADITSLPKFRSGVAGPKDSEVANLWNAFLPNLTAVRPNVGQKFAQVVHTDGVTVSLLFIRPKPAEPPDKLPCMGKEEGAVNPLAHLHADWLGCDPGRTNMATVAHEERYPSGAVKSVWQRSLTAGQYAATTLATWPAMWAELSKWRWSNARFRLYGGKQRTVAKFWAETVKGARVRCNSAATGRPLALDYGAASFSGSGSIGSKGVPVKQMQREACKQFPGRVVLVHEFRTSRVSSARTNVVAGQAESFRWLHPVRSMATRSRIRGLMCSTSNGIRFYDRDVSAALNIARIAAGPGRPRELRSWLGRPAMPNPGRPGQEWVQ